LAAVLQLLQQLLGIQAWAQLFANLAVLLQGINDIKAGGNLLQTEISVVEANQATAATALTTGVNAILTAIGATQQAVNPVVLPTIPPAGYGAAAIAFGVWDQPLGLSSYPAGDLLLAAGNSARTGGDVYSMRPLGQQAGWWLSGAWDFAGNPDPALTIPEDLDPATILVTDLTPLAWATRIMAFPPTGADQAGRPYSDQPRSSWRFTYWMGTVEFAEYKAARFGGAPTTRTGAPVWPGLAKVTLGTPVALDRLVNVNTLMDGVIIELDTVPPDKPFYQIGSQVSTTRIGQIAFQDDDLEMEAPQVFGFSYQVVCPTAMVRASGCKLRTVGGVTGFVTPWLIT
jgi:hypothetical protein